jgi:hypothetical protein
MKAKTINEVLRSEDEWANQEIEKRQYQDNLKDQTVVDFKWAEPPEGQENIAPSILRLAANIERLEDWLFTNGLDDDKEQWIEFVHKEVGETGKKSWTDFNEEELEFILGEANYRINAIKRRPLS